MAGVGPLRLLRGPRVPAGPQRVPRPQGTARQIPLRQDVRVNQARGKEQVFRTSVFVSCFDGNVLCFPD